MPIYCSSKTIPSEISMSGDYLRLEGNKGRKICPCGFDQPYLPGGREFDQKICPVSENLPQGCPGEGGVVTLGID